MKRFQTYLTEIDKVVGADLPDDWNDPFRRTIDDRKIHPRGTRTPTQQRLEDLLKKLTHGDIDPGTQMRPSAYLPNADDIPDALKKEHDRLRQSRIKSGFYNEPDVNIPKYKPSPGPGSIEQGTFGFTKDDIKQLKEIEKARNEAAKHVDDVAKETTAASKMETTPKGTSGKQQTFQGMRRRERIGDISSRIPDAHDRLISQTSGKNLDDLSHSISGFDDYTPEEQARLKKIKGAIEKAASEFQTSMSDQATKLRATPKPPSMMSRIGTIAKAVAKNPLLRAGGKALGVLGAAVTPVGMYYDAQSIADKLTGYEAEEMERRKRDPNRSLTASNLSSFVRSPGTKF